MASLCSFLTDDSVIADHVCRVILNRRREHGVHACVHAAFKDSRTRSTRLGIGTIRRRRVATAENRGRARAAEPCSTVGCSGAKVSSMMSLWDFDVEQISFLGVAVAVSVDPWYFFGVNRARSWRWMYSTQSCARDVRGLD